MDTSTTPSYRGYRLQCEIIAHCVWQNFRYRLRFRDIREMMLERGVNVSYEAIQLWCLEIRRRLCKEVAAPTRAPRRHVASR